jgi:hypothetical protein
MTTRAAPVEASDGNEISRWIEARPVAAIHNNYRAALDVTVPVKPGN